MLLEGKVVQVTVEEALCSVVGYCSVGTCCDVEVLLVKSVG
jgi:hypothetical protein